MKSNVKIFPLPLPSLAPSVPAESAILHRKGFGDVLAFSIRSKPEASAPEITPVEMTECERGPRFKLSRKGVLSMFSGRFALMALLLLLVPAFAFAQTFTIANNIFPTTAVGQSVSQNVVLTVNTSVPITSIAIPASFTEYKLGTISGCTVDSTGATTVLVGSICVLPVTFTPVAPGKVTAVAPIGRSAPLLVNDVESGKPKGYSFGLLGGATAPLISLYPGTVGNVTSPGGAPGCGQETDAQGDGCPAADVNVSVDQVAIDSAGNIFIVGGSSYIVQRIDAVTGIITQIAGQYRTQAQSLDYGDGGPASKAQFYLPIGIAVDGEDNVYVLDYYTLRKIDAATGIIHDIIPKFPANITSLPPIQSAVIDLSGNVFFSAQNGAVYEINAKTGALSFYAGNDGSTSPATGIGGLAANAGLGTVMGLALDSAGNLYLADQINSAVYRIDPITTKITEYAGTSTANAGPGSGCLSDTGDGGAALSAYIDGPISLAFDPADNLYLMEGGASTNERLGDCPIRRVDAATGLIHTVAATSGTPPNNRAFVQDPSAADLQLNFPDSISVDSFGNLYIVSNGEQFNKIASGQTAYVTFATEVNGTVSDETADVTASNIGIGTSLAFANEPFVASALPFSTYPIPGTAPEDCSAGPLAPGASCGIGVQFNPTNNGSFTGAVPVEDNSLNVAGQKQTIGMQGGVLFYTAPVVYATFSQPGLAFPDTSAGSTSAPLTIQLQAAGNGTVDISSITITGPNAADFAISANGCGATLAPGSNCNISVTFTPSSATTFNAALSVADNTNGIASPQTAALTGKGVAAAVVPVAQLQFAPAVLNLFAGNFTGGYSGDNGPANQAAFNRPTGIAYDATGNLYIADTNNSVIRKIDATGTITTFAGNGKSGYSGDNGPALSAELTTPAGLVFDPQGNLYISDNQAEVIRKIDPSGTITTFAGNGNPGYSGDNGPATSASFDNPQGIALDNAGNLYVADSHNEVVRMIDTTGTIKTFAGNGAGAPYSGTYTGDGGPATSAGLSYPYGVAPDNAGNVYISDSQNQVIRVVNKAGIISTFAGNGSHTACNGFTALNTGWSYPAGIVVSPGGDIYIASSEGGICVVDTNGIVNPVVSPGGGLQKSSIGQSDLTGATNGPIFFVLDPAGNVLVVDNDSSVVTSSGATGILTFASQQLLETSSPQYITITNPGAAALVFTGTPTITGPFAISGGTCNLATGIAAGADCTIGVTFTPAVDGAVTGNIVLNSNAVGSPATIQLKGTGSGTVTLTATITPNSLTFTTDVNTTSGSQSSTLTNTGQGAITISSIGLSGGTATDFAQSNTCGTTLAAGASCILTVTYSPKAINASGEYTYLNVTTNAQSLLRVLLTGFATAPAAPLASLSPATLVFPSTAVGSTLSALSTVLSNTGNATLNISGITLTGANVPDFTISANTCGTTLAAGNNCSISATFTPGSGATFNAAITVADNAANTPQSASLTGTGIAQALPTLTPAGKNFGAAPLGQGNGPIYFTLNNNGSTPITGIVLSVTGPNATDFELYGPDNCSGTLAGNSSCSIEMNFYPSAQGSRTATLNVAQSGTVMPLTSALSGTGTPALIPQLEITPAQLDSIAGTGKTAPGCAITGTGGPALQAHLCEPYSAATDSLGNTYLVDANDNVVLKIDTNGNLSTFAGGGTVQGDNGPATGAILSSPTGVAVDLNNNVYLSELSTGRIRVVSAATGTITTFVGGNTGYFVGGTSGTNVTLLSPGGMAFDLNSNLYIAVDGQQIVVEVSPAGVATLLAGVLSPSGPGYAGYNGDNIPANTAYLNSPQQVAIDKFGQVYIADTANYRVRMVSGGTITTVAGTGTQGDSGDGGPATSAEIGASGVAASRGAEMFVTDGATVRQFVAGGNISTIAGGGTGTPGGPVGGPAIGATFGSGLLGIDNFGDVLIPEYGSAPQLLAAGSTGLLQFGDQPLQTTSKTLTITLNDLGNDDSGLLFHLPFTATGDFSVTGNNCTGGDGGVSSCTITVTFTPTAIGARTGSITVTSNAASGTNTILLQGNGTSALAPLASLSPTSISFPNTAVGSTATAISTVLSNAGTATLNISGVTLTGANPSDFTIAADTCGTTLAAGSTCTISATFTPSSAATFNAAISVADNAANTPQTATLSGTGTPAPAPLASLSPSSLSFPNTAVGSTATALSTTLSNSGNAVLSISSVTLAGANVADFAISSNTCGSTLAAGASCTISATFTPASAATFSAAILVADNAANTPQTATLSGTGTAVPASDFTVTSATPSNQVQPGANGSYTIEATGVGGAYNSPVTFTVTGLPSGATYTFVPPAVTPGSTGASTVFTVHAPSLFAELVPGPHSHTHSQPPWLAALLLIPLAGLTRLRRVRGSRLLGILLGFLTLVPCIAIAGCAGGGYDQPGPETYTVTVTGTSGALQHSTTVTLTVE